MGMKARRVSKLVYKLLKLLSIPIGEDNFTADGGCWFHFDTTEKRLLLCVIPITLHWHWARGIGYQKTDDYLNWSEEWFTVKLCW